MQELRDDVQDFGGGSQKLARNGAGVEDVGPVGRVL